MEEMNEGGADQWPYLPHLPGTKLLPPWHSTADDIECRRRRRVRPPTDAEARDGSVVGGAGCRRRPGFAFGAGGLREEEQGYHYTYRYIMFINLFTYTLLIL